MSLPAQLAPPNDRGVSIGHVHLMLADPEAHKKLWVGVLGAQVTNSGSLELLKLPGIMVVLGKARTPTTGGSNGSAVNHFGFVVKSYDDIKAKLSAAGLTFAMDRPANKQLIANFPEDVRVEFTEAPNMKSDIAFQHIHEAPMDQAPLQAWYVKTFGAVAGMRSTFPSAVVPGGEVDFLKVSDAVAPTKGRALDHIGFEIKGLEAFCKNLEAQGVPFDVTYREMPQLGGLKLAYIIDPIGTRIELTEGYANK